MSANKEPKSKKGIKKDKDIEKLKKERDEYLEGWRRERASFANYKKDMEKYLSGAREASREDIISKMLPVFDNIDLVIRHIPKKFENENWYKGAEYVYIQFKQSLSDINLEEIKCVIGSKLDLNLHEAIKGEGDRVEEVIQKGYKLNNRVIRPVKVKINKNQK